MKKFLLPALLSMAVLTGNAQQKPQKIALDSKAKFEKFDHLMTKVQMTTGKATVKQARKAKADGLYYTKPDCTLWQGESIDGGSMYPSLLILPPYGDLMFNNKSANPSATSWTYADEPYDAEPNGDFDFGSAGPYQTNGLNMFSYLPVLIDGKNTFSLSDINIAWAQSEVADVYQSNPNYFGCYLMRDTLNDLAFTDATHSAGGAAWGICQPDDVTSWLFGNGKIALKNGAYTVAGFSQIYPRPYNLYLTSAHAVIYTQSKQPVPEGTRLRMAFYNVVEEDGEEMIGDRLIGEFFADATTVKLLDENAYNSQGYTKSGVIYMQSIEFKNEYQNAIGSYVQQPIVLNEKFAMVITGMDQPGVDFTFLGTIPHAEEDFEGQTSLLVWTDDTKEKIGFVEYQGQVLIDMTYRGMSDYVYVLDEGYDEAGTLIPDLNVLQVSADGKTVTNDAMGEGVAMIYIAYPWVDDQDLGNYYIELPEWISDVEFEEITTQSNGNEMRAGYGYASPVCDPLPAGVTGRYALLFVEGKGYTSEAPIIVLQGDASLEEAKAEAQQLMGIKKISKTYDNSLKSASFNLAGQKVNSDYKGLVIRNGKKIVVK